MMRLWGLTLCGILAGAPVLAMSPVLPACAGAALVAGERGWSDYDPFGWGGGIVAYTRTGGEGGALYQFVIEHCPSRQRAEAVFAIPQDPDDLWEDINAYNRWLYDAFTSADSYSLRDLARAARGFGGQADVRRVTYTSCGCALRGQA
jgi:hypothetical protein